MPRSRQAARFLTLGLGRCALLGVSLAQLEAAAAGETTTASAGDQELFLWLGLGCFGLAAALVFGRFVAHAAARRQRSRALRLFWSEQRAARSRGLLRWFRRAPAAARLPRWEQRTRAAEQKAEQALALLRSELAPHLAQLMKDRLVWSLMAQRARLLSAQQANADKVSALEHRLAAIQLQLRRQAEAYEHRIAELERELDSKSAVTRELLKFRVRMARQALEAIRFNES